jgi:hypothetical protein
MSSPIIQEVINVSYTNTTGFPAGTVLGSISAVITGTATGNTTPVTVAVTPNAPSITVPLIPDSYTWTLTNMDGTGAALPGGVFTGTGTVQAPVTVTLELASGLSFT